MSEIVEIEMKTQDGVSHRFNAIPKTFKSGREGFYTNGKVNVNGDRFQVGIILTKITPKATTEGSPSTPSPSSN